MRTRNITLVDSSLLEKNAAPEPVDPSAPGATLPADFPRDEFSEAQLILLEELCFQYTREFILRFFRIISSPVNRYGDPVKNNINNIACQTIVLAKLLGLNSELSWHDIAATFGISKHTVLAAKDNTLKHLDRLATRSTRSRADWLTLATLARRQARLYTLKATTIRKPTTSKQRPTITPDLAPVTPTDMRAGN